MNIDSPKISIIVPVYNTGSYLSECIESILSQSYSNYELILVDDGSTDDSIGIELAYSEKHPNIRVLYSNTGCVSSARNMGIENAVGTYLLFVDSDDYLLPGCLRLLISAAEQYPDADFIQAPFAVLSEGILTPRSKRFDVLDKYTNIIWDGIDYLERMTFAVTYPWNSLIKREFLLYNNLHFNSRLTAQEDLIFVLDLFLNGAKGILLKDATYVYRFGRPGSLTSLDKALTDNELAKRKRLLNSLIESSKLISEYINRTPRIRTMLNSQISYNLTGCIGGSVMIHSDKEIFDHLTDTFKFIPVAGPWNRKLLAILYNISPKFALSFRRLMFKLPFVN